MTWTYDGAPGKDTADGRRDAVRLLVGDTDTEDQQVTDEEIAFALSEASNNIYRAASVIARSLAGKYSRMVDSSFETISNKFSQIRDAYYDLALRMEREAKKLGGGLGVPVLTGVSEDEMRSVEDDEDRPDSAFRRRQFRNPTGDDEYGERYYWNG